MVNLVPANMYHLQGAGIHISYNSSSFAGMPQLTYQDAHLNKTFSGKDLSLVQTPIGTLATVTTSLSVDTGSTSFSVLIPAVNVTGTGQAAPVHTDGITTVHRFSNLPAFNQGQKELYTVVRLHGTATQVEF